MILLQWIEPSEIVIPFLLCVALSRIPIAETLKCILVAQSTIKLHSFQLIPENLPHEMNSPSLTLIVLGFHQSVTSVKKQIRTAVTGYLKLGLWSGNSLFHFLDPQKGMHAEIIYPKSQND